MSVPLRVLLVEDSPVDAALLERALRQGGYAPTLRRVETAPAMQAALEDGKWDLILADHTLPQFSAPAALALLQERGLDIPLIIASGTISEELAVACMQQGAADFLLKDRLGRLSQAVAHALEQKRLREEKRQAEAALHRQAQEIRALVEHAPDVIARFDHDLRYRYINPAAQAVSGLAPEAFLGKTNQELGIPLELAVQWDAALRRGFETGRAETIEFGVELRAELRYYEVRLVPELTEEGAVGSILTVARDITERKRAEEERAERAREHAARAEAEKAAAALRAANQQLVLAAAREQELAEESERRAAQLDAIIASIADGVVIYDAAGRILRMNETAQRLWGYQQEEQAHAIETRASRLQLQGLDGKPLALEETPGARALRGETIQGMVMQLHGLDKSRWVTTSSAPLLGLDGTVQGAVVTFSDITPLHELQEQREDLLRTISHDLRTPLTLVQGHAQMLLRQVTRSGADASLLRSAEAIIVSARRIDAMLRDLLEAARVDSGQFRLEKQPTDLGAFVRDLLQRSAGVLDMARVRGAVLPDLLAVDADQNHLERILTNLVSNALKYSSAESEVLVSAERGDGEVRVSVTDQGDGIAPEDLPYVFERYYRGGGTKKAEGLGLGLYVTRALVEAHGGRIWAESQPGHGSTFSFTLPACLELAGQVFGVGGRGSGVG